MNNREEVMEFIKKDIPKNIKFADMDEFYKLPDTLKYLAVRLEVALRHMNIFLPEKKRGICIQEDLVQIFFDSSDKKIPFVYIEDNAIKVYFNHPSEVFADTGYPVVFDEVNCAARFIAYELMKNGWKHD